MHPAQGVREVHERSGISIINKFTYAVFSGVYDMFNFIHRNLSGQPFSEGSVGQTQHNMLNEISLSGPAPSVMGDTDSRLNSIPGIRGYNVGDDLKDTCFGLGKISQNKQLLDILACNSANRP